jgi:hypothetical protein
MHKKRLPLNKALEYVRQRRNKINPNEGFLSQLIQFEEKLFGRKFV